MLLVISDNLWVGGAFITLLVIAYVSVALVRLFNRASNERSVRARHVEHLNLRVQQARKQLKVESQKSLSWSGTRKFVVVKTQVESLDKQICSFYFQPHDEKPIPLFNPGQYLTFDLTIPGQAGTVTRCYSLSDSPKEGVYRVSIKRVPPPPSQPDLPAGLSSNYFHDLVKEGDILDLRAPSGKFFLDMSIDRAIVLIGGGIGLTPVLSMLNTIIASGGDREVWFFYGLRNRTEHAMRDHLKAITEKHANIRLHVCYSQPDSDSILGEDYDHHSFVSVPLFKEVLPSNNYQYLMCGPPPMMESLITDLAEWGVPKHDVLRESFGPAAGRKAPVKEANPNADGPTVTFKKSGKSVPWDSAFDSLVKFAESNGCEIPYACLSGNCGTCLTTIIKGEIDYLGQETDFEPEQGTCLACSCIPNGPIEIDA